MYVCMLPISVPVCHQIVTGPGDKFFLGMYATVKECDDAYARFEKRYNDAMALDEDWPVGCLLLVFPVYKHD